MYHYLFTNDLRISVLDESLKKAADCFLTNTVPSATEDKSANNNMKTLGFYFNLYEGSGCAKEAADGNIRAVVLNFIKKFQFPNLRTKEAYEASRSDEITLAPMRTIIKVLYCMNLLQSADSAFLTKEEISKFIFYNSEVAKTKHPDLGKLISNILDYRKTGTLPQSIDANAGEESWKHGDRQLREMIKVLVWSGCVIEKDNKIYIDSDSLTRDNKADIYDIVNCNSFWNGGDLDSYRNYMDMDSDAEFKVNNEDDDPYKRAAKVMVSYKKESGYDFSVSEDVYNDTLSEFQAKFAPSVLKGITDNELLKYMFYSQEVNNDSLCYWLEFNNASKELFGSIAGGSSYKFGLFQSKDTGIWMTGSGKKPKELSEAEALAIGKEIRDVLLKGAEIIESLSLEKPEDYELLDDELNEKLGKYATFGWIHKYFLMIYPEKFSVYHSTAWQNHVLYSLGIMPSEKFYGRSGQIAIICRYAGYNPCQFAELFYDKYGFIKKFIRIGTTDTDNEHNLSAEMRKSNTVAIGWNDIGTLLELSSGRTLNREAVTEALKVKYYPDKPQVATRKSGEFVTFYSSDNNTVFVPMEGEKLLALADEVGDYFYDETKIFAHRKPAKWHNCFEENESLPNKSEGHLTTCYEITDPANLLYLYDKYYNSESHEVEEEEMSNDKPYIEPKYYTGIIINNPETGKPYAHNRIVFGAPGTGKSFKLDGEQKELIKNGGEVERVTFHPDYSYAHFVGTYKPVPSATGISYEYVPGPFMRTYVEAIKNGRSENIEDVKPYLLLIEEINRANVAAVFGEVFQLLDRDDKNKSQYAVKPSEDIKAYLAKELGGKASDYKELIIPDNMYIWSTMNSADQGVFPMDTAFKRRWDFEYIGINHNDSEIDDAYLICENAGYKVKWNQLRRAINDTLSSNSYKINEDKLMGPFFVSRSVLEDAENFREVFKSKVIMYLFEDAAKQRRSLLFEGCDENTKTKYSTICEDFDKRGIDIFCKDVRDKVEKIALKSNESEGADNE